MDSPKDELVDKFLLQVIDNHVLGTERKSLFLDLSEIFILADVSKEGLEAVRVSLRDGIVQGEKEHTTTV